MTINKENILKVIMRVARDKVLDSDKILNRILKVTEK